MKRKLVLCLSIVVVMVSVAMVSVEAQKSDKISNPYLKMAQYAGAKVETKAIGTLIKYDRPLPRVNATSSDWGLHNGDLSNNRYSTLDQINDLNISSLVISWIAQTGLTTNPQSTPIVVNGVMYVTDAQGNVFALDAGTGERIWTFLVGNLFGGGEAGITNRGVTYGDGAIYLAAGPSIIGLDAATGEPLAGFGTEGASDVLLQTLKTRFPTIEQPIEVGYAFTMAPQYYNGVVFAGTTLSEAHIPGGLLFAVDAKTGAKIWEFNTVPQDETDPNFAIAGPTWVGGVRNGGGMWETPALDPDLGMLYVSVANTSPDVDGTARIGINLFTDSVVALDVATGQLKWYYQQVHHDLWDYDSASHPALFDVQIGGQTVKAVAQAQKNGYLYILNRETGRPLHGDIETPVPTATNVPGEEPWPTQPVPLKVNGQPMEPFVPLFPSKPTPENATAVPWMTAPSIDMAKPFFHSPGVLGGANFAPLSYSAKTGLVYVVGIDWPCTFWVTPVGATLLPGQSSFGGGLELIGPPTGTLTAYDPATGELVWQTATPGYNQAGSAVTAGNLVFVGDHLGYFYAFDATTGTQMWKFNAGSYVKSSPMIYEINGKQFISVNAGDDILTFGLPGN